MADTPLDKRAMVALFELIEQGYRLDLDSPTIGWWPEYGHYKKTIGMYTQGRMASRAMHARITQLNAEGHVFYGYTPLTARTAHLGDDSSDVNLTIEEKLVPEKSISTRPTDGALLYDGKVVQTTID